MQCVFCKLETESLNIRTI